MDSPGKRKAPEGAGADATTRPDQPPESYTERPVDEREWCWCGSIFMPYGGRRYCFHEGHHPEPRLVLVSGGAA
jgi:hypothetical protein